MVIFTSITANYIPKARVLARTVKKHCPHARFVVMLCDALPPELHGSIEPFDELLQIEELGIPVANLEAWTFSLSVVELCTAVKGAAFLRLFEKYPTEKVMYLDPDIVVLDSLEPLERLLDQHSVLVTPHLTEPYDSHKLLVAHEAALMTYGIYNFGFLAVKDDAEGRRFATWWRDRLTHYCHVDLPMGFFTDQRWGDLIPNFFPTTHVVREKTYNVATWNLKQRKVECNAAGKLFVEGQPVRFYHFSGFDNGAFEVALKLYGADSEGLVPLAKWYRDELEKEGQSQFGKRPGHYACFDDGTPVMEWHRVFYRNRPFLADVFPNPYATTQARCYLRFFEKQGHLEYKRPPEFFAAPSSLRPSPIAFSPAVL